MVSEKKIFSDFSKTYPSKVILKVERYKINRSMKNKFEISSLRKQKRSISTFPIISLVDL